MHNIKAVGYIRVSTSRQGAEGVSLAMQVERIEAYMKYKGFLPYQTYVTPWYKDELSGSGSVERAGFELLLKDIEESKGGIEAVVIYSLSRFTRSTRELLDFVDKYVIPGRVELHSVVENLDTSSPTGRFMLKVMGAMNELEREQIVERTQAALDHKRSKGEKLGGYVPYGFDVVDKVLVANSYEQNNILIMKQLHWQEGHSYKYIADILNDTQVPTKMNGLWDAKTISRILKRA